MLKLPPLSFQGNKKLWRTEIIELINEIKASDDSVVYVDLFGGSGIISHWIKHLKPNSVVIYNDYDNYTERLNKIDETNEIIEGLREITQGTKKDEKLSEELKNEIIELIESYNKPDLLTIESLILFNKCRCSNKTIEELKKSNFYNRITKNKISVDINEYLNGLIIEHKDWEKLYNEVKDKYKDKKIFYILDPPYIYTDKTGYDNQAHYWKLKDSLKIIRLLRDEKYWLYFNSDKSGFDDIIEGLTETLNLNFNINFSKITKKMQSINGKNKFDFLMISEAINELKTSS